MTQRPSAALLLSSAILIVATIVFLLLILDCGSDIAGVLYVLIIVPIACLIVLFLAVRRRGLGRLTIISMLVIYGATSWALCKNSAAVRDTGRWFLHSSTYKAEVFAQPETSNEELRHIEWDGWGWGGNDTNVYLVYNPDDSLSAASRRHSPGRFTGIPCEVFSVRRLESHWYAVEFYTNTSWADCGRVAHP